ncbi:MAG: hypothetical protein M1834_003449 [Cirrosporium novae-zelandiae]|nr:MAG: hypothetical protein M1834_003449 [Cirrosporium novae-zelandiae]
MNQEGDVDQHISDGSAHPIANAIEITNPTAQDDLTPNDSHTSPEVHAQNPSVSDQGDGNNVSMDKVFSSDIGVTTLLNRLKQSIGSCRDFAAFLKKRSAIEEDHAQGLKKLCRGHDIFRRPEHHQESYTRSYEEINRIHEHMADQGIQFSNALHQISDELQELASNIDRGRKHWKQAGLAAEKKAQDAENAMSKAKVKYDGLSEDYDRARTGDRSSKKFGLKGSRSAAQHEEDLFRKVQTADADYASKVQFAQKQQWELMNTLRPQATRELYKLITECDAGLTCQMQLFAALNERWLLSNSRCVSPLKSQGNETHGDSQTLRDIVGMIDNEKDFKKFIASCASKIGPPPSEIKYEQHPILMNQSQAQSGASHLSTTPDPGQTIHPKSPPTFQQSNPRYSYESPLQQNQPNPVQPPDYNASGPIGSSQPYSPNDAPSQPISSPAYMRVAQRNGHGNDLNSNSAPLRSFPPLKPVFGVSLQELFHRDGSPVPMIASQCMQAVDLYGLEVEGIYRLSGTASHVNQIKELFDHDSSQVDFRNPEIFFHDVNSVAGLLKQFFRELPDPLLTAEHYDEFVNAARADDDNIRRDTLHAVINSLPDPNYATLRALVLHLNRVQEHSQVNRMTGANLAIVFGPTLMGVGRSLSDAGWQVRVIDTILQNTYQIFDDD